MMNQQILTMPQYMYQSFQSDFAGQQWIPLQPYHPSPQAGVVYHLVNQQNARSTSYWANHTTSYVAGEVNSTNMCNVENHYDITAGSQRFGVNCFQEQFSPQPYYLTNYMFAGVRADLMTVEQTGVWIKTLSHSKG